MFNNDNEEEKNAMDQALIDAVRHYPHLYDRKSRHFKDNLMKRKSWKIIAFSCNMSTSDCRTRWTRLREKFSREKRLRETCSPEVHKDSRRSRKSFALFDSMLFLDNHVKPRKPYKIRSRIKQEESGATDCTVSFNSVPEKNHAMDLRSYESDNRQKNDDIQEEKVCDIPPDVCMRPVPLLQEIANEEIQPKTSHLEKSSSEERVNPPEQRFIQLAPYRGPEDTSSADSSKQRFIQLAPYRGPEDTSSVDSSKQRFIQLARYGGPEDTSSADSSKQRFIQLARYGGPEDTSSADSSNKAESEKTSRSDLEKSLLLLCQSIHRRIIDADNDMISTKSDMEIFGIFVARQLEKLPDVEIPKRQKALIDILFEPFS